MEKYILYVTKNIHQIRKSPLDTKLDKNLRNTLKNYAIDTKMFDDEDIKADNREADIEKKDKSNIDLFMADSYSHAVTITQMHWKKQDFTDCLESSILYYIKCKHDK